MEHIQTGHLNNDFRTCLWHLNEHGMKTKPRGVETKELLNYNITLGNPRNRIINFPDRKTNLRYLLGEFVWYLSGQNTLDGILPYSKFWAHITNSGTVAGYEAGTVNSNYGHRIFGHDAEMSVPLIGDLESKGDNKDYVGDLSQWNAAVEILKADKDSRQAIINIHRPSDRHAGNKDVACTLTLQFFIREDKLFMITNMRSNDIIRGFTNDVFQFTMLQEALMLQLRETYPDLELGYYYHNAGSMHVYSRHFEMSEAIIKDERSLEMPMIPMDVFDDDTCTFLVATEAIWRNAGMKADFDFDSLECFQRLSPYWQNLIKMCFAEDEEAMHFVFGIPEHGDQTTS
jgi:thymidylate synthase